MHPRHLLAVLSLSLPTLGTAAPSLALDFPPAVIPVTYYAPAVGTFGWILQVSEAVDVVGVGWWDYGTDGLAEAHEIGVWRNDGTLLTSAYVPAGQAANLVNGFRVVDLPRMTLGTGLYRIGGTSGAETDALGALAPLDPMPLMYPGLHFTAAAKVDGAGLNFPSLGQEFIGYFGPTLLVERPAASVDESGSSALLLVLPLSLAALHRIRRWAPRRVICS